MRLPLILLHHADAADPDLLYWIQERINSLLKLNPLEGVLILGALIVVFPLTIGIRALIRQSRNQNR